MSLDVNEYENARLAEVERLRQNLNDEEQAEDLLKDLNLPQFDPQQEKEYLNNLKDWDSEVFKNKENDRLMELARRREMKALKEVLEERLAKTQFN
jgi:hypothetical protein